MRSIPISIDEHYHICNRGAHKRRIFYDAHDYARFLFLLLFLQSPVNFANISRPVRHFVQHSVFNIGDDIVTKICDERYVELIAFCLMPNHFHVALKEVAEGGIARYMQRVLNAYTKYHNARYETSGHLFAGPYRAVHVADNKQLLYLSTYIHRNPRELRTWKGRETVYPYSSFMDFVGRNRWGRLLASDIVCGQFKSSDDYLRFARESTAKQDFSEFRNIFPSP